MSEASAVNRLSDQTSPYLRQHAGQPVAWQPWDDNALELARHTDRPILLSIGYAACHWCHVMAHECFDDPAIAETMNRFCVNIKVDREQRPDLDRVYQTAHQLLTRRAGGWPLTVFLDPHSLIPFFAGTYFPPAPRHGMPGFADIVERVATFYREHHGEIVEQAEALTRAFVQIDTAAPGRAPATTDPVPRAVAALQQTFDSRNGGFGDAPKFPQASSVAFLLRQPGETARGMAHITLSRMADSGLFDHLGGGFFRYSVDERWEIPHFEKMLYDNALLLPLYAEAAVTGPSPRLGNTARLTASWLAREMRAPEGAFYATLDADSDGCEGGFYLWDRADVESLLAPEVFAAFRLRYGLDRPANMAGAWHLRVVRGLEEIAADLDTGVEDITGRLERARQTLLEARSRRPRPGLDDKLLTAWNALAITGLARAAIRLDDRSMADLAEQALGFLVTTAWRDGRLYAVQTGGEIRGRGLLEDHAFLAEALLTMLELRWSNDNLALAGQLAERLLADFSDPQGGAFFMTPADHEPLIFRPRPLADESLPSGNAAACRVLLALGNLLGETRYLDAAGAALEAAAPTMTRWPQAHAGLISAWQAWQAPDPQVILRASAREAVNWRPVIEELRARNVSVLTIPPRTTALPPLLARKRHAPGGLAWLCRGRSCLPPIARPETLRESVTV
ncbi:MAG: thioredoxin domain-containing protein [Gammaproteobacteria bacterium]|jgi:hypothetical protein